MRHGAWGAWLWGTWGLLSGLGAGNRACQGALKPERRLAGSTLAPLRPAGSCPSSGVMDFSHRLDYSPPVEKRCTGHSSLGGRGDVPLAESPGDNLQSPGLVLIRIQTPWIKTSIICSQGLAGTAWPGRLRGRRAEQSWGWSRANEPASALAQAAGSAAAEVSLAA